MARWRSDRDPFPAPLREFVASEWAAVQGECLERYACRGAGYGEDCVPRPGEYCGQLHYEMLGRDFPGEPDRLARAKRADAKMRWRQARLAWLGADHPDYEDEVIRQLTEDP